MLKIVQYRENIDYDPVFKCEDGMWYFHSVNEDNYICSFGPFLTEMEAIKNFNIAWSAFKNEN